MNVLCTELNQWFSKTTFHCGQEDPSASLSTTESPCSFSQTVFQYQWLLIQSKVANSLDDDLFLNINYLAPSDLNSIIHSHNFLPLFRKINASWCRQNVHICLLHEIPTRLFACNCQSGNCIGNILNKLVYQMSNAKYMLLQNTCPSVGRDLAAWHNYWFPIKPRFYCWRRGERKRKNERKKPLVEMQNLTSVISTIVRVAEKIPK